MSEASFYINAQSERGPERFKCTGDNTELYLHADQYAEVDHIFTRYDETQRTLGAFVFRNILGVEEFDNIAEYMIQSCEYMITYRPVPTDSDFDQYLHHMSQDLEDGLE
jgi:hypothetical protein